MAVSADAGELGMLPGSLRWSRYVVQSPTGIVRMTRWTRTAGYAHLPDGTFRAAMLTVLAESAVNGMLLIEHEPDPAFGDTATLFGSVEIVRCHIVHQEARPDD